MRIVNMYYQRDTQSAARLTRKLHWQRVMRQRTTDLAGDFNAPSSRWDPRCQVQWNDALCAEVIDKNGLEVGNDGQPTHYWTREDHDGESVIGLTLANRPITKWFILEDDHTTGSDHNVIQWEVEADRQEVTDHERVVGLDIAAMTEGDVAAGAETLWAELAKERAHLDAECTEEKVEQEAAWCQEATSSVLNAMAKKIKICTK